MPRLAIGAIVIEMRRDGPYVLLARRGRPPREGQWSLPGGKLEERETLVAGVAREVREETKLDVRVEKLVEVVEIIDESFHYVIIDYLCSPIGGTLKAGDDCAEVRWVPVYDVGEYDVTPAVRRVVSMAISDERE
jgi:ADP-ribose pyrophosphatase YjhB (NUDIX family)